VGTLLLGINLAERADLQEKFISNNERYQKICDLLKCETHPAGERLLRLAPTIRMLERYRFVASSTDVGPLLAAAQLACRTLAACNQCLPEDLANAVAKCAASERKDSDFRRLAAIEALNDAFDKLELAPLTPEARNVRDIIQLVWMSLFQRYYRLKEREQ
jgi:hypothetical protein